MPLSSVAPPLSDKLAWKPLSPRLQNNQPLSEKRWSRADPKGHHRMSGFPTCAWWLIAPVVLLSPVLAFLAALAVEIFVGVLKEADTPALLTLLAGAGIGRLLFR